VSLQWNHNSATPQDDIIDPSHKGPYLVYLSSDNGANWFKIFHEGYDNKTGKWAVDHLISNKGLWSTTIPRDIAAGNYLIRGEILALHGAGNVDGIQPYVDCAELTITGGGTAKPSTVKFPGAYRQNDPGILINIYWPVVTSYTIPGPPVYAPKF